MPSNRGSGTVRACVRVAAVAVDASLDTQAWRGSVRMRTKTVMLREPFLR